LAFGPGDAIEMTMIPVNEPLLAGREAEYVLDCVKTGWISSAGKYIERFEKEWAAYCGRQHGVAVCNGTVALELAVSALALPPGGEVILPSFTIVSCLEAVLRNGLTPVLVDCDPRTYCMDVAEVLHKVGPRTVAVMPVHIYGHPVNMEPLLGLCRDRGLRMIEDAAEAHGADCRADGVWRRCGSFGDLSCFSFYANKNITCGEGGMVLADDEALARRLRSRRNLCFGERERFAHEDRGWNFRMTNLQAALGCAQYEQFEIFLARKREMASRYNQGLAGLPLQVPHVEPWATTAVWMYAVLLNDQVPFDAVEFARRLAAEGIQTRPFFKGLHEQPVYRRMGLFADGAFPVTEHIYRRGLYLPSGQAITDQQIEAVVHATRKVLA
jgi:perosamine synthetase